MVVGDLVESVVSVLGVETLDNFDFLVFPHNLDQNQDTEVDVSVDVWETDRAVVVVTLPPSTVVRTLVKLILILLV